VGASGEPAVYAVNVDGTRLRKVADAAADGLDTVSLRFETGQAGATPGG
jgi:hypothetical protein